MPDSLQGTVIAAGTVAMPTGPATREPQDGLIYGRREGTWVPVAPLVVTGYPDFAPGGRLSFSDNDPGPTPAENVTSVHYLPATSPIIPIFNGTGWERRLLDGPLSNSYTDATQNPAALGGSQCADLFIWDDGGTLRLTRGPGWAHDGGGRPALTRTHQFRVNGTAITNGPAQGRGTWVGTVATWSNAQSYRRLEGTLAPAINHVWNVFNTQLIVARLNPNAVVNGVGATWQETNISVWIVTGELVACQVDGGTLGSIQDFYLAITTRNMQNQLLGELMGGDRRGLTRGHTVAGQFAISAAFMFGPGVGDFTLSSYSPAGMTFSAGYIPPISAMYEA